MVVVVVVVVCCVMLCRHHHIGIMYPFVFCAVRRDIECYVSFCAMAMCVFFPSR